MGGVEEVQGAVAKRGLAVLAPCGLLLVAVAWWIVESGGVAVSLRRMQNCSAKKTVVAWVVL